MRLQITPITVDEAVCNEAEVSVAVSSSVAIRIVPVDGTGTEYPEAAVGIVGTSDQPDIAAFLTAVGNATQELMSERGV